MLPKNRVIVRNKKVEYGVLYDLTVNVLKEQTPNTMIKPEVVHERLDGVVCVSCCRAFKKYADVLKVIEPMRVKIKELFAVSDNQQMIMEVDEDNNDQQAMEVGVNAKKIIIVI